MYNYYLYLHGDDNIFSNRNVETFYGHEPNHILNEYDSVTIILHQIIIFKMARTGFNIFLNHFVTCQNLFLFRFNTRSLSFASDLKYLFLRKQYFIFGLFFKY